MKQTSVETIAMNIFPLALAFMLAVGSTAPASPTSLASQTTPTSLASPAAQPGALLPLDDGGNGAIPGCGVWANEEAIEYIIETAGDKGASFAIATDGALEDVGSMHLQLRLPVGARVLAVELPSSIRGNFRAPNYSFTPSGIHNIILNPLSDTVTLEDAATLVEVRARPPAPPTPGETELLSFSMEITRFAVALPQPDDNALDLNLAIAQPDATVLVDMYSIYDIDRSRTITIDDVNAVRRRIGLDSQSLEWADPEVRRCDLHGRGAVGMDDLLEMLAKYEKVIDSQ